MTGRTGTNIDVKVVNELLDQGRSKEDYSKVAGRAHLFGRESYTSRKNNYTVCCKFKLVNPAV